jgi:hypothetical protein
VLSYRQAFAEFFASLISLFSEFNLQRVQSSASSIFSEFNLLQLSRAGGLA